MHLRFVSHNSSEDSSPGWEAAFGASHRGSGAHRCLIVVAYHYGQGREGFSPWGVSPAYFKDFSVTIVVAHNCSVECTESLDRIAALA